MNTLYKHVLILAFAFISKFSPGREEQGSNLKNKRENKCAGMLYISRYVFLV